MDNSIRAGDLVMIVKPTPCCGSTRNLGRVFVAGDLVTRSRRCVNCRGVQTGVATIDPDGWACQVSRLKKIPPLVEPQSIVERDTVKA